MASERKKVEQRNCFLLPFTSGRKKKMITERRENVL
jgi:hypothetical protein